MSYGEGEAPLRRCVVCGKLLGLTKREREHPYWRYCYDCWIKYGRKEKGYE